MEQTQEFLMRFTGASGYALFFVTTVGCGIGLPMNSDLLFIAAAVLAALGYFNLGILLVLAFFGLLTGDSINFFVARRFGRALIRLRPFSWVLKEDKVRLAEHYLATRGNKFLFVVRFLPLIRTVLFFTAGTLKVSPKTFYTMDGLSTLIYLPLIMGTAYFAGDHSEAIFAALKKFQFGLLGLIVVAAFYFIFRKKNRSEPAHP